MKVYNLRLLIICCLFFSLIFPTYAEQNIRYYDIELVVFENLEENTDIDEIWPQGKELIVPENAATLGQQFTGELPPEYMPEHLFKLLAQEEYQLQEEVETLKESEKYRVLLHTGWRQPGLARNKAIPIFLSHAISDEPPETESTPEAETVPSEAEAPVAQVAEEKPATPDQPQAQETETGTPPPPSISQLAHLQGVIKIVLSRYLHLDVELLYQKEARDTSVDMFDTSFLEDNSQKEPVYYMKQNRRMRSKETHYIDHPKFSMLVRITPFKVEPPPEPITTPPKG